MQGIFQEALRAAIERSDDAVQRGRWTEYHHRSVEQGIQEALNASKDALDYGLDRLCLARSLLSVLTAVIVLISTDNSPANCPPMANLTNEPWKLCGNQCGCNLAMP